MILLPIQFCLENYWGMKMTNGMQNKQTKIVSTNPRSVQEKCRRLTVLTSYPDLDFNLHAKHAVALGVASTSKICDF